jgi:hypothetical protein
MIRRDTTFPDGSPGWLLVMQADHARIAGRCAELWGAPPFARLEPHAELVTAIYRHDDGWSRWEQAIAVDPANGRPREFTEMVLADALSIWPESIASAATVGPLAGYVVSGHFSALLTRFSSRWIDSPDRRQLAEQFLLTQAGLRSTWLAQWMEQANDNYSEAWATESLRWLQMFDNLSLWLCCQQRTEPETFSPPVGPQVTFTPLTSTEIKVAPWPFTLAVMELEVPARRIAAGHYASTAELAAAPSQTIDLAWRLIPG